MWSGSAQATEAYVLTYDTYDGALGCPSDEDVRADVAAHVRDRSRAAGATVALRIVVQEGGFVGSLIATDAAGHRGQRSVSGRTCAEVAHALAFLAGLAIELGGSIESENPATAPPAPPPPPEPPPPSPPPRSSLPPSPPRPPLRWSPAVVALAEVRGGIGNTPRPATALGVDLEAVRTSSISPVVRLAVVGGDGFVEGTAGSARLWLLGGRLEACPVRVGTDGLALRPCAGVEAGAIWVRGMTPIAPRTPTVPWASAEATLRLRWIVTGGLFIEAGGGAMFPFLQQRYYAEPNAAVYLYAIPSVTWRAETGLGLRF